MLHITVIANGKKKKKMEGGGWRHAKTRDFGGEWRNEKKGNEGDERGWMEMWKDRIRDQSKEEWNEYVPVYYVYTLALFLLGSAVCVWDTLPFQQTEYAQKGEKVRNTGQNRILKRKSNKTWKRAFIICTPYIICHPSTQTSRAEQKQT